MKHFELERGQLHYHDKKGERYGDTIRLHKIPVEIDTRDPRVLVLTSESRIFHLRAESSDSANEWFLAIKSHTQTII